MNNTASVLNQLRALIEEKHLLKHPFYQAWMSGELTLKDLQDYAIQYRPHVDAFPQFVALAYGQAPNGKAQKSLLQNLREETGDENLRSHPELWQDFAQGLGVSEERYFGENPRREGEKLKTEFFEACRSSYAEALGTLYAYEAQVPKIADQKIKGLETNYGIQDEKTLKFFAVHQEADQIHSQEMSHLINDLNPAEQSKALEACRKSTLALWNFLDGVYQNSEGQMAAAQSATTAQKPSLEALA